MSVGASNSYRDARVEPPHGNGAVSGSVDGLPPVSGLALLTISVFTLVGAVAGAGGVGYLDATLTGSASMALMLFAGVVGMGLPLLVYSRRAGWGWRDWGFRRPKHSIWHLVWQIPLAIFSSALITLLVFSIIGGTPAQGGAAEAAFNEGSILLGVLAAIAAIVLAPLIEEMLFRRLILDWLRRRSPIAIAVLITAALFAVVHILPPAMVYVGLIGLWMTVLRVWTGALWHSVALHAANNALVTSVVVAALSN